ncbi:hypothetical protein IAU60_003513 [Kwoniella sp. DSM 27419]
MAPVRTVRNILMELRKICQHPYLSAPELEPLEANDEEQQHQLINASGKLQFLKLLLPKLKTRGHRVLLFSQFKIALDRIEDFLYGEGIKFLRLDGDVQQAQRQKSMDLFNAPNSDYDVFLLTTRAGGVGINLATADTVIIYDPDFNPHQDLQAIARSHRYGQKKKVLVFKLMVKGSVEENIINKGKKKMVLDHLVVQQMGKENEEGDIDDLLLRGAEAVYSNQGGINEPDIVYTSKNVDELIDKVEADADAEAQAAQDREKAIANGEVDPGAPTQAMQFGFAKIWEADQNELRAVEDAAEAATEKLDVNWEAILQGMQQEKENRVAAQIEGQRIKRMRKAAAKQYKLGSAMEEDSHDQEQKSKGKGKGKSTTIIDGVTSDGDEDFTFQPGDVMSDDDDVESISSVPDALSGLATDDNGNPKLRGLAGKVRMSKKDRKRLQAADPSNTTVSLISGIGPLTNGLPGKDVPGDPSASAPLNGISAKPVDAGKDAKRKRNKETKLATVAAQQQHVEHPPQQQWNQQYPLLTNGALPHASTSVHGQQMIYGFAVAHIVLAWLFAILRELKVDKDIAKWGFVALSEPEPRARIRKYMKLAQDTDNRLVQLGLERYFSLDEQVQTVNRLFLARLPAVPEHPIQIPPYPPTLARAQMQLHSASSTTGHATPPPQLIAANGQSSLMAARAAPSSTNQSRGPSHFAMSACESCGQLHDLKDCPILPSIQDLRNVRDAIRQQDPSADANNVSGKHGIDVLANQVCQNAALGDVKRAFQLLVKAGRVDPALYSSPNGGLGAASVSHSAQAKPLPPNAPNDHSSDISTRTGPAVSPTHLGLPATGSEISKQVPRPPDLCIFCKTHCGRSLRACIEANGGRRALKDRIRVLEEVINGDREKSEARWSARLEQTELYDVYKSWPRDE